MAGSRSVLQNKFLVGLLPLVYASETGVTCHFTSGQLHCLQGPIKHCSCRHKKALNLVNPSLQAFCDTNNCGKSIKKVKRECLDSSGGHGGQVNHS